MKLRYYFSAVLILVMLVGCSPSQADIQEAIEQTQKAMPTVVPTNAQTAMPTVASTSAQTATTSPTRTPNVEDNKAYACQQLAEGIEANLPDLADITCTWSGSDIKFSATITDEQFRGQLDDRRQFQIVRTFASSIWGDARLEFLLEENTNLHIITMYDMGLDQMLSITQSSTMKKIAAGKITELIEWLAEAEITKGQ